MAAKTVARILYMRRSPRPAERHAAAPPWSSLLMASPAATTQHLVLAGTDCLAAGRYRHADVLATRRR
jgi:hypothetical protein